MLISNSKIRLRLSHRARAALAALASAALARKVANVASPSAPKLNERELLRTKILGSFASAGEVFRPDGRAFGALVAFALISGTAHKIGLFFILDIPVQLLSWDNAIFFKGIQLLLIVALFTAVLGAIDLRAKTSRRISFRALSNETTNVIYAAIFLSIPLAIGGAELIGPILVALFPLAIGVLAILWQAITHKSTRSRSFMQKIRRASRMRYVRQQRNAYKKLADDRSVVLLAPIGVIYIFLVYAVAVGFIAGASELEKANRYLVPVDLPGYLIVSRAGDLWLLKRAWRRDANSVIVGTSTIIKKVDDPTMARLYLSQKVELFHVSKEFRNPKDTMPRPLPDYTGQ